MSNSKQNDRRRAFPGLDAELGPALPLSHVDTEWLIEQAVERALNPEKKPVRWFGVRALSLAALGVVTSAAAATVVHQQLRRSALVSAPAVTAPQRQTNQARARHTPAEAKTRASVQSTPSEEATPRSEATVRVRERTAPPTSASNALLPAQEAAVVDELSAANDLRRRGQWQAAEAAYRDVAAQYPHAPQATVARLAAAELRLEHLSDAAGALRAYQSVPPSSALGVEALFGASRAYRALQNSAAETATLRELLDNYPTSLQADAARKRLKELSTESADP